MKHFSKIEYRLLSLFILGLTFFVVSCNEDNGYSLGNFRVSIATVELEGNNAYSLTLDNGKRLWPAASNINYRPKENQRVFVNYTLLSDAREGYDHFIKVNDIWDILTKESIDLTAANVDSIGNDPVKLDGMWIGNGFLNVHFFFNYGGGKPHAINLVNNTLSNNSVSNDTIFLEFRHNAYNSSSSRLFEGFACFDLKPFQKIDADSVIFSVKVKDWGKEKNYSLVYRYKGNDLRSVEDETTITPIILSNEYY